mmetsp:Transcript_69618/g.123223  ORF Transcript_69618/g.123223 Transcript_69618/m.123223 type:complete len:220 (-) Transcript_69618:562-1221(-)
MRGLLAGGLPLRRSPSSGTSATGGPPFLRLSPFPPPFSMPFTATAVLALAGIAPGSCGCSICCGLATSFSLLRVFCCRPWLGGGACASLGPGGRTCNPGVLGASLTGSISRLAGGDAFQACSLAPPLGCWAPCCSCCSSETFGGTLGPAPGAVCDAARLCACRAIIICCMTFGSTPCIPAKAAFALASACAEGTEGPRGGPVGPACVVAACAACTACAV